MSTNRSVWSLLIFYLFLGIGKCQSQQTIAQIDSLLNIQQSDLNAKQAMVLSMKLYQRSLAIGYPNGIARSLQFIALNLFDANRYGEILRLINKSEKIAHKLDDKQLLARILTIKASCFVQMGFMDQAAKKLNEAEQYALQVEDVDERHLCMGDFYRLKANYIELSGSTPKTLRVMFYYSKKAYQEFGQIKNDRLKMAITLASLQLGKLYQQIGEEDSSLHYLDISLANAIKFKQKLYSVYIYIGLASLAYYQKQYQLALNHYFKALRFVEVFENNKMKKVISLGLANVYEKLGNKKKVNAYLKQYIQLNEILNASKKEAISTPIDEIIEENEKKYQAGKYRYRLTVITIISLMPLTVVVAFWIFKRIKKEDNKASENACLLKEKIKEINAVKQPIKLDRDELKEILQLAINNAPSFLVKFKAMEFQFFEKLNQISPKLVESELILCAYLRLHFETKEIARYTHLSVRAVQAKKYRIRKKLNIPTIEDMNVWMSNL